jgi:hypothetical protein
MRDLRVSYYDLGFVQGSWSQHLAWNWSGTCACVVRRSSGLHEEELDCVSVIIEDFDLIISFFE